MTTHGGGSPPLSRGEIEMSVKINPATTRKRGHQSKKNFLKEKDTTFRENTKSTDPIMTKAIAGTRYLLDGPPY
jgi:hypothetical protein